MRNLLTCQRALRAYVLTWQPVFRAYVLTWQSVLACLSAHVPFLLSCSRANMLYVIKCQRVLRVFRHKESSKIMISQIYLAFLMSLTKNGHFVDMDPNNT